MLAQLVARERNKVAASIGAIDNLDDNGFPRKYFKINVHKGRDPNELQYVPVGVNGFFWKIRRGADVIVPQAALGALDHAISGTTEQVTDASGKKGLVITDAMRFPYQNKGEVSETDYTTFQAAMRAQATQQAA